MIDQAGSTRYVLRKKPPGEVLSSAHAVEREFQVSKQRLRSNLYPRLFLQSGAIGASCDGHYDAGHGVLGEHRCAGPQSALPLHRPNHHWHAFLCHAACSGKPTKPVSFSTCLAKHSLHLCPGLCHRLCGKQEVSSPPQEYFKMIAHCLLDRAASTQIPAARS